jgi:type IV secretory pathway VirJ component
MNKFILSIIALITFSAYTQAKGDEIIKTEDFGNVSIFRPDQTPKSVIIFISGDGGWDFGHVKIAKAVASKSGAIVAGIDYRYYAKRLRKGHSKCAYPAGDLEEFSMMLEKKLKLKQYFKPILLGYSSGATIAYGAMAQAPANTFKGVIALGFAPDIDLNKTLCNGSGLSSHAIKEKRSYYLEPSKRLTAPFIVLQGIRDKVCPVPVVEKYMSEVRDGELIVLPNIAHDFKPVDKWMTQFLAAYNKILTAPSFAEQRERINNSGQNQHLIPLPDDFPITVVQANTKNTLPLAFVISGDGGWTSFDQAVAENLASKGISVVGLDAQKYFWEAKTPEEVTANVSKVVIHFMQQWNKKSFILVGYSFGACVVPFVANRMSAPFKEMMKAVFAISPDERADFEIHISDMVSIENSNDKYNVINEIKKAKPMPTYCFFGDEEDANTRIRFMQSNIKVVTLKGDHGYNGNSAALGNEVWKLLETKAN